MGKSSAKTLIKVPSRLVKVKGTVDKLNTIFDREGFEPAAYSQAIGSPCNVRVYTTGSRYATFEPPHSVVKYVKLETLHFWISQCLQVISHHVLNFAVFARERMGKVSVSIEGWRN